MENMRRWINYDWFKLVVALILLVIFIFLMMQQSQSVKGTTYTPLVAIASTPVEATQAAPPTPTLPLPSATAPQQAEATLPAPTSTPTPQATSVPTQAPTATTQPEQSTLSVQTASGDCSKALPTRLDVGKKAKVITNLYFRKEPGMDKPILQTNFPGTQLEIIGGPVCMPYGVGVYRWWNVKTTTAETGWSAEGSLLGKNYFLDPLS